MDAHIAFVVVGCWIKWFLRLLRFVVWAFALVTLHRISYG